MKDSGTKGYYIKTYRFQLFCEEPDRLVQTQRRYQETARFYAEVLNQHPELFSLTAKELLRELEKLTLPGRSKQEPAHPLPLENIPSYFRRAAINAAIGAKKAGAFQKREKEAKEELQSCVVFYSNMYRNLNSREVTLRLWDKEKWQWTKCRLKGRKLPDQEDSQIRWMSPCLVIKQKTPFLHIPVREPVEDIRKLKDRLGKENVCGLRFTNTDAFAVASVLTPEGKEKAVRFFRGGSQYRHHCTEILKRIEKSEKSQGTKGQEQANKKYWLHLKHLNDYWSHKISREVVQFCQENQVKILAAAQYEKSYSDYTMLAAGNWSPLHLSSQIKRKLQYKAWRKGILTVSVASAFTSGNEEKGNVYIHAARKTANLKKDKQVENTLFIESGD